MQSALTKIKAGASLGLKSHIARWRQKGSYGADEEAGTLDSMLGATIVPSGFTAGIALDAPGTDGVTSALDAPGGGPELGSALLLANGGVACSSVTGGTAGVASGAPTLAGGNVSDGWGTVSVVSGSG